MYSTNPGHSRDHHARILSRIWNTVEQSQIQSEDDVARDFLRSWGDGRPSRAGTEAVVSDNAKAPNARYEEDSRSLQDCYNARPS